jgi:hypothetical protein
MEIAAAHPADSTSDRPMIADLKTVARHVTLGAAAGGLGGLLAGGVGGRLAMFALRVTTDPSIAGIESDDGFTMGRFDLLSTLNLFIVTMVLGSIVGMFVVAARPFFANPWMPLVWAVPGATFGGAGILHSDGVDFNLLKPTLLAVLLFIAIPGAGAAFIAFLVDRLEPVWWRRRTATVVGAAGLIPLMLPPVALGAVVGSAPSLLVLRVERLRDVQHWLPARIAAGSVFALISLGGAFFLAQDLREIL